DMQPDDYVFKVWHQIEVVLIASDYDYTIRPKAGTKLTVKLSEVTLPIVK
ncbi:CocE/NonD family hydrolase C-terminal non-catalytic domain-containing protein, partial [Bacillus thuringiensis]